LTPQQLDEGLVRGPGVFGETREQSAQVLVTEGASLVDLPVR